MIVQIFNFHIQIENVDFNSIKTVFPSSVLIKTNHEICKKKIALKFIQDDCEKSKSSLFKIKSQYGSLSFFDDLKISFHSVEHKHFPCVLSWIMMQIIQVYGAKFKMCLMHASSVVKNNQAVLIPGSQELGKTTLSQAIKNSETLNDDLSLIVLKEDCVDIYQIPESKPTDTADPFIWGGPFRLQKIICLNREKKDHPSFELLSPQKSYEFCTVAHDSILFSKTHKDDQEDFLRSFKHSMSSFDSYELCYQKDRDELKLNQWL